MTRIELTSTVGADGILRVELPVGMAEANRKVKLTVESEEGAAAGREGHRTEPRRAGESLAGKWKGDFEPAAAANRPKAMTQEEWVCFVDEMAGAITDPTFRRHEQGDFEPREPLD